MREYQYSNQNRIAGQSENHQRFILKHDKECDFQSHEGVGGCGLKKRNHRFKPALF